MDEWILVNKRNGNLKNSDPISGFCVVGHTKFALVWRIHFFMRIQFYEDSLLGLEYELNSK